MSFSAAVFPATASSSRPSLARSRRTWPWRVDRVIRSISFRSGDLKVFPHSVEHDRDPRHISPRLVMSSVMKKIFFVLTITTLIATSRAEAGSIGDFFKALGNSIAHPGQKKKAPPTTNNSSKIKGNNQNPEY